MARRLHLHQTSKLYGVASNKRIFTFLAVGFGVGMVLGYIAMGTLHAFLDIGARRHHGQREDIPVGRGVAAVASVADAARQQAAADAAEERQQELQAVRHEQQQEVQATGKDAQAAGQERQSVVALQQQAIREQRQQQEEKARFPTTGDTIHVLATSNGSPYLNFQTRIMYATFKLAQKMPAGEKMVAFTRILHRTKPDILMNEVPTFRADPLTPKCDDWCEYPVSDRPNAVRQFFDAVQKDPSMIKAPWLFMIETDYVWMKPLVVPRAEDPSAQALGFPFGYIVPTDPGVAPIMRSMYPDSMGPLSDIPNSGPAPILMQLEEWLRVTPKWEELAAHIERTPEAVAALGWVREMYAFSLACAVTRTPLNLSLAPKNKLIVQPPADHKFGDAACAHYTWGATFKDAAGKDVWVWDKRAYTAKEIEVKTPSIPEPPPFQEGWKLQDGVPVSRDLYNTLSAMIKQMNKGIATLQNLA